MTEVCGVRDRNYQRYIKHTMSKHHTEETNPAA